MPNKIMADIAENIADNIIETGGKAIAEVGEGIVKSAASEITEAAVGSAVKKSGGSIAKGTRAKAGSAVKEAMFDSDLKSTVVGNISGAHLSEGEITRAYDQVKKSANAEIVERATREQVGNNRIEQIRNAGSRYSNAGAERVTEEVTKKQARANASAGAKPKSLEEYKQRRIGRQMNSLSEEQGNILSTLNSPNDKSVDGLYKKFGVEHGDKGALSNKVNEHFSNAYGNVKQDTTVGDFMGYHKVPEKAAAVGGTAWLVNKMSASKGKQSNADLYGGQQQQYR
jgi:hypothetical protein